MWHTMSNNLGNKTWTLVSLILNSKIFVEKRGSQLLSLLSEFADYRTHYVLQIEVLNLKLEYVECTVVISSDRPGLENKLNYQNTFKNICLVLIKGTSITVYCCLQKKKNCFNSTLYWTVVVNFL